MVASQQMTGNEYRISYEQQGDDLILQMGPQHPSTHGVLRLELTLDGELVKHVRPHIGYLHRCFEKHAEAMTYPQVIPYADRMDYVGAMCQELGYVLTVEKLMGSRTCRRVCNISACSWLSYNVLPAICWPLV